MKLIKRAASYSRIHLLCEIITNQILYSSKPKRRFYNLKLDIIVFSVDGKKKLGLHRILSTTSLFIIFES